MIERTVWSRVRSEVTVERQDGKATPEREGLCRLLGDEKAKTVSAKGSGMLLSRMGDRGESDGGEIEARRTRGLDLRRREQFKVKMSAWPPRSYCV